MNLEASNICYLLLIAPTGFRCRNYEFCTSVNRYCLKYLNIDINETTKDGNFTLKEVECLGACVNAPMVQINDDYYEDLNKDSLIKLLENLKSGNKVKIGPQIKERKGSESVKLIGKNKNAK